MEDAFSRRPRHAWARAGRTDSRLGRFLWVVLALVLAHGQAGCSQYMGSTAASFLRRVREEGDPNVRYLAYAKLGDPECYERPEQKAEAVRTLVESLQKRNEPVASRAVIVATLGMLRDPAARDVVVSAVSDPEPLIRVEACRALGKVGKPEDATILARVMATDTLMDARIAAIDGLGELKANDPRIHRVLVSALENEDPATRYASLTALKRITGKDYGVEAVAWRKNLIGEDSKTEGASPTLLAAPAQTFPSNTTGADVGVYPPKPAQQGVTLPDPDARNTNYLPSSGPQPFNDPNNPKYPPTNPNLPPPR